MKRRKTAWEKWFSWSRHQRRQGASEVAAALQNVDFQALKQQKVAGRAPQYTHGSQPVLSEHLERLRGEFAGQAQLLLHHASLIVLIRREADVAGHYAQFRALWEAESTFLCRHLNLRWLVSACDTFIDHDANPLLRALMMQAVLLVNTVKLCESERFLQAGDAPLADQPCALHLLQTQRVALFDGLSAFTAGTDDTLRNMRWRLQDVCALHPLGALVLEIFDRLQREPNDNVYLRFRRRHTREKTRWW